MMNLKAELKAELDKDLPINTVYFIGCTTRSYRIKDKFGRC